jgi:predicted DNA binding CopG/RHH family protein
VALPSSAGLLAFVKQSTYVLSNERSLPMADEQKENKENLVALRLNNEQMLAVRQWAHQHNANVSQVIRSAIELMTGAKQ